MLVAEQQQSLVEPAHGWRNALTSWGKKHVTAVWFPWALTSIGFIDYFTFGAVGFILTPLLTIALLASSPRRAALLIGLLSAGCFTGSLAFSQLVGWLGVSARLAGSPQLEAARGLLQRHGVLAGAMNTILPLPTIPLIVAAHALEAHIFLILLSMALGRLVRWSAMYATLYSGRRAMRSMGDAEAPKDAK